MIHPEQSGYALFTILPCSERTPRLSKTALMLSSKSVTPLEEGVFPVLVLPLRVLASLCFVSVMLSGARRFPVASVEDSQVIPPQSPSL